MPMGWAALNLKSVAAWKRELDTHRDDGCRRRRALTSLAPMGRARALLYSQETAAHQPQSGSRPHKRCLRALMPGSEQIFAIAHNY